MTVTHLNKYKQQQKSKLIETDLIDIIQLLDIIIAGLNNYKKYKPVNEIINTTKDNKKLLRQYLNRYKKLNED